MTYIKHIEGRFKQGKRDEAVQMIVDFYNGLVRKVKGFKGFIMTGSLDDTQKAVNISLWETREEMDNYYANDKDHSSLLETLKPLIEQVIEKGDYTVFKFNIA